VFYRRVDGQFDHGKTRTNDVEARAIVEEIISRLDSPLTTDLSIGVVTLNIQQRNLVESYLDSSKHPKIKELRETEDTDKRLFVLNLESVQGRERDIIVMGTSFSKRAGGAAMPLNFGPLTNADGEKRLNVAVTRARRQFVVVTSFDPEEMSGATSLGMVHLREYLQHAARRGSGRPEIDSSKKVINQQAMQIASRLASKSWLALERQNSKSIWRCHCPNLMEDGWWLY
jgi:superfamily I DNA and/or RNA helicase